MSPRRSWGWAALAIALTVTAAGLLYITRGTTLWVDEWTWAIGRRGNSIGTFLDSYNGHLSLVPIAIYRVLFATAGLSDYLPYRVVVVAGHLLVVVLSYVYVKRRVGEFLALLGAVLLLLFGPGWQNFIWPFQIAWLIAIASGIGALLMLDRRDRRGDAFACLLLAVALASTSVGVAIAVGLAFEIAWARRSWRELWIVAIPIALYALWSAAYQHTTLVGNVYSAVGFAAQSAADSLSALVGLSGASVANGAGTLLQFGAPLAVVAAAALLWFAQRRVRWSVRAVTILLVLVAFWGLTGISRSEISGPYASRYLYVGGVFVVLLAAEFARGVKPGLAPRIALAAVTAAAVLSNVSVLRDGAGLLRGSAAAAKADLTALDLSASFARPTYIETAFPGYPFVSLRAVDLLAAQRALGSPAESIAALEAAPEGDRNLADAELTMIRGIALRPSTATGASGAPPSNAQALGGTVSSGPSCVTFAPSAAGASVQNQLQFTAPPHGVWISATGSQATVGVRRFGAAFQPAGTLPPGASATLPITPDASSRPWQVQVASVGAVKVCGL